MHFRKWRSAWRDWIIFPAMFLVPIVCFLSETLAAPSLTTEKMNMGVDWLTKFGYLPPPDPVTGQLQTQEALTKAIKAMQKYGGLEPTGVLDEETLVLMKTPRCSLPDVSMTESRSGRRRRSVPSQTKWSKRHLSWRVRAFPKESQQLGRDTVRALMYYALKVWSDVSPLNFHEVASSEADIQIEFTKADHHDGYPFDGPGGTVAHAFYPGDRFTAGDTHFDDDEDWTFRSPGDGMDLFAVAVHEFGHAIGLSHTSAIESIMRPYYQGPVGDPLKYSLPYEDKVRVWQLYGVRDSVSHTERPDIPRSAESPDLLDLRENRSTVPLDPDAPDRCSTDFDAVAQIRGEAFFFKGKYFWRLTREKHLVSLRPARILQFWRGLPANLDSVDAVYERPGDHKIVFFKGLKYWIFKDNNVEEDYPRRITSTGAMMIISGRMDLGYPKDSMLWKGVPPQLDDAMRWSDGASYFFKGKEYWRVEGSDMEVESGYPRPIGKDWLLCTDMQSDSPTRAANDTESRSHGQRHTSHAEKNYEVCSCTSDSATTLSVHLTLLHIGLLHPPYGLLTPLVLLSVVLCTSP
ncbi:hypothetical protein GJAV_G00031390 [Gymnothorax javanicus]|nr:hypothetical protein GJAV_G00031390 [Gymnothorax javanicus]